MINVIDLPINKILHSNCIELQDFLTESYNSMLISIFEVIVTEMEDINYKKTVKQRYLNSINKILTTQKIIYEKTNCKLDEKECEIIYNYLCAFFSKINVRKIYDDSLRIKLLQQQQYKCNICKKSINIETSELDHVIPWCYVGDELGFKNLQMLCKCCNRRKSKNSSYNLKMFLINKYND